MFTYKKLAKRERSLKAFTGFSVSEFEALHKELLPIWERRFIRQNRIRKPGGGRTSHVNCFADELVLILTFYRNYPVYEILGFLFNLDISNIGRHINTLEETLAKLAKYRLAKPQGIRRIRTIKEFYEKFPELDELIGDATEQPIERPQKKSQQKKHYSGKKKRHTLKTQLIIRKDQWIYDVSLSYPGHIHDKTIMTRERTPDKIPKLSKVRVDNAYQKIQREYPDNNFILPEKANRWHKLNRKQKKANKEKSSLRIPVEHTIARLKNFKVLAYKYRHDVAKYNRTFRNICGLNNFRLDLATAY